MMKRISALILALMMVCLAAFAAAEVAAPKEDAQAEDFAGAWVCSYVVTHDGKKLDAATNLEVMNMQEVPTLTIEGNFRAHQVPIDMSKPEHLGLLEDWLRSYKPEELFTDDGKLVESLRDFAPKGDRRMGANPPGAEAPGLPGVRHRAERPRLRGGSGHDSPRLLRPGRGEGEPHQLPGLRPRREQVQPSGSRL